MPFLTPFLFALIPAFQDFEQARAEFRKAVVEMNAGGVRDAAERLVKGERREAVDALLDGNGICAGQIRALWQDKLKAIQEMDANADFRINTNTNPPTVDPGSVAKYQKFQQAQKDAQAVERRIMGIDGIKRSIVDALAAFKSDAAVKELCGELKANGTWFKRAGLAEALGRIPHALVPAALVETIRKDPEPQVRVAAIDASREMKERPAELVPALVEQLGHEYWQVRHAAVAALRALGARDAVDALVDALPKNEGRLRHEMSDALAALTGVDKHADPAAWKAWWDAHRDAFQRGAYKPPAGDGAKAEARAATTFYGIPVKSKNVVFILDRSGSMAEPSEWDIPPDVTTGGARPEPDVKKQGNRKIDIARWQLKRALAMLPEGTEFNLIFYNHEWTVMSERMVKISAAARKQAFDFIDRLDPVGATNIYDPLEKGLSFATAGAMSEKLARSGVDTVFFLTDGMPNAGQIPDPDGICAKIRDLNKTRKVAIHTIGVFSSKGAGGVQPNEAQQGSRFLQRLASENAGVYTGAPEKKK